MNKLKLLDLFSGIGGFSYGLEQTQGFETIAFCEKDAFCQKVLQKHWKNIKIYDDIRDIKGSTIKADIVTGGFPCQPFSIAGKQRGTDDDRYLWDETIRVVAETKPRWFIGENVDGLVNIQEGKVLQQIQKDLEAESFQVQCVIIPASGIGAWHQRKRIWIVGYSEHNGSSSTKIKGRNSETSEWSSQRQNEAKQFERTSRSTNNGSLSNSIGIKLDGCSDASRISETEQSRLVSNKKRNWNEVRSKAERCSEQDLQHTNNQRCEEPNISKEPNGQIIIDRKHDQGRNAETWWQTQSKLCGVPNGISTELDKDRANRIKSLGNSIVPEIVKELGLAILAAENE
jgi:DNA (cytosine-5)-methyltransferase 1